MCGLYFYLRTTVLKQVSASLYCRSWKTFHWPLTSISATGSHFASICDSKPSVCGGVMGRGTEKERGRQKRQTDKQRVKEEYSWKSLVPAVSRKFWNSVPSLLLRIQKISVRRPFPLTGKKAIIKVELFLPFVV